MNRLSVDIDLDYHRYLEKEKVQEDRELILKELDDYMLREGYTISNKSRVNVILSSRTYCYINAANNKDNIKVEINFIDRVHLYPLMTRTVAYFGKSVDIALPTTEELYGMKIAAVIDRSKPRDLYDIDYMFKNINNLDQTLLKNAAIFYLSLDGIYNINNSTFGNIKKIKYSDIKKELFPVLKKGDKFDLFNSVEETVNALTILLSLNDSEKLYLKEFSLGHYKPSLLFDSFSLERAEKHPMAIWRIKNNQK